ncbi:hypothetical protein [Jannaschia ovalis]|uniref:DUF2244 domain-containing protein n=1 Tax=Jannaschia ovalis TaxID=3038773 RepID=A0ABY8LDW9_9RHOB|nr:hypothetical protein [Jannaschia sp. GRR-S6-38]WGH79512.1 hypothetical protein P8627_04400 [Jannaschia sp. GRR-S6-38]
MIRPEAAARLRRWREAIAGAVALAAGLWLLLTSGGLPFLFGLALLPLGAVLALSGIRHARFRSEAEAPGIVEVDEGRITYLGPVLGGSIALDELDELAFRRAATGEAFWRLAPAAGPPVWIPEGARGAETLLDALAPLPGLDAGAMVRAVQDRTPGLRVVWRRTPLRALT